jgi:phospholipase/carboxylesterase
MLETVVIEPAATAERCVIWLHGLGADGHDFAGIVPDLELPEGHGIRFVFPHAPIRPVTINQNMAMRAWYDIYALNKLEQEDEAGMNASSQLLQQLIEQQAMPHQNIVLAGFSQGGAMALLHGITADTAFAGIIGLSTYLPMLRHPDKCPSLKHQNMPILLGHGSYDDVIPLTLGEETRDYLKTGHRQLQWLTYPMAHQVCSQEIQDIGQWIKKTLL